jgi:hypothetical protein
MSGPLDGVPGSTSFWPPFVSLSLTLFALGSADLGGGFCLRTLSFGRPKAILEPVLDTVVVSCVAVGGTM